MLDKHYDFKNTESKIYQEWEEKGYFKPDSKSQKEPFSISMPPPNANGSLHVGHAMVVTIQDIMTRIARMKGQPALYIPGADHAGILTQVVFERKLSKQKISRYDLGREEFVKQCMEFSQDNKQTMYSQVKVLGASCDWSREAFTLDKQVSAQVLETFKQLFDDGLIYRDYRMINWDPKSMTALSDLELEHKEVEGKLYFLQYPLAEKAHNTGQTRYIMVATTRPETMLGDTAVAVNPNDRRYKKFIGEMIELPLTGRKIPVIADEEVDMEFGTGAVKVTPAHDPMDFAISKRHNLEVIGVIGFNNKMTEAAGKFAGLKFSEAREEVVKALREKDLLVKVKNYKHQVGHSERSGAMIQPQYSLQWFVKVEKLVEPAIKAIKDKEIKIVPTRFEKMSIQWLENLRDWCISRQLWWGHQIPVWYKSLDGMSELQRRMNPDLMEKYKHTLGDGNTKYVVSLEKPKGEWIQDPDTLDTWFSSAQWPFTILDYPDGADFKKFYPNSVMETGYDILNVWVTKMIMMGIYRTGKIPFKKVYLHGLVQDAKGQKMSKSKGNVVNPLELVEKYGADGLRMALIVGATPGNDVSLGEDKVKGYRNFANKIWNMTRFILMNAEGENIPAVEDLSSKLKGEDKKFLEKVEKTVKKVTNYLEKDQYSLAGEYLYAFIWHEFADQYIETSKDKLKSGNLETLAVLMYSLKTCLKLLHPYMPFVTERIWKEVRSTQEKDLIVTAWPK